MDTMTYDQETKEANLAKQRRIALDKARRDLADAERNLARLTDEAKHLDAEAKAVQAILKDLEAVTMPDLAVSQRSTSMSGFPTMHGNYQMLVRDFSLSALNALGQKRTRILDAVAVATKKKIDAERLIAEG